MTGDEILIIEDSATQAEQLRYILERNNYRVSTALNGREALSAMATLKPALIVSDIVITKPYNEENLVSRIKQMQMDRHQPKRENSPDVLELNFGGQDYEIKA